MKLPLVLVSGATATMARLKDRRFGVLVVPAARNKRASLPLVPGAWAMDNGAFSHFDVSAFESMLDRYYGQAGCLFVTAPDVVGDAAATLRLFRAWEPRLRRHRFPVAWVAQDGATLQTVPWGDLDAVFVGGTTAFKWGRMAMNLAAYGRALGKHVHYGRVNTARALRRAMQNGA